MYDVAIPKEPVKVAVIGTGFRSSNIYSPLYSSLKPWMEVVAVCDPVRENADAMAAKLNVKAYYDIHRLVKDKPMEAAIVITPVESHHSISVFLSSNGIHNLTETTWCSMLIQAKDMIKTAKENNVIARVAENFFYFPVDCFSRVVRDSQYLGPIKRIFSYNDHTGYHNNSRWIHFAGKHPIWVQSLEHKIDTIEFYSTKERYHNAENYHSRYFMFPDNLLVVDQASNAKGFLGRLSRPGYTEWQGDRGTMVHKASAKSFKDYKYYHNGMVEEKNGGKMSSETELLYCSDAAMTEKEIQIPGGYADHISRVALEFDNQKWIRSYAETPSGILEYVNPFRPEVPCVHFLDEYGAAIMSHIVDFILSVRGMKTSEFTDEDALMSLMMELGAAESARLDGKRINLPLVDDLGTEQDIREKIKKKYGVDPMDVEGMLAISYPKP